MKVARTVLSGGKDGDNFKVLPIATKWEEPRVVKARGSLYKGKAEYTTLQINNIIKLQINASKDI